MSSLLSTRPRRLAALVLALLLLSTVAYAVWRAYAPVDGSVSTASAPTPSWNSTPAPAVVSGNCSVSLNAGKLVFTFNNAVPGATCTASAAAYLVSGTDGVIQSFAPADDGNGAAWTLGTEFTASTDSCGVALNGTPQTVQVSLTVEEAAQPATTYSLGGGLEVVPSGLYDAALCS